MDLYTRELTARKKLSQFMHEFVDDLADGKVKKSKKLSGVDDRERWKYKGFTIERFFGQFYLDDVHIGMELSKTIYDLLRFIKEEEAREQKLSALENLVEKFK